MSRRHLVVYRLLLQDPFDNSWAGPAGVMDEICIEFDTSYCIPGHPYRIIRDGIWFRTDGMVIEGQEDGDPIVVFIYREETDDET